MRSIGQIEGLLEEKMKRLNGDYADGKGNMVKVDLILMMMLMLVMFVREETG